MKVRELIATLQEEDPEAIVILETNEIYYDPLTKLTSVKQEDSTLLWVSRGYFEETKNEYGVPNSHGQFWFDAWDKTKKLTIKLPKAICLNMSM